MRFTTALATLALALATTATWADAPPSPTAASCQELQQQIAAVRTTYNMYYAAARIAFAEHAANIRKIQDIEDALRPSYGSVLTPEEYKRLYEQLQTLKARREAFGQAVSTYAPVVMALAGYLRYAEQQLKDAGCGALPPGFVPAPLDLRTLVPLRPELRVGSPVPSIGGSPGLPPPPRRP